MAQRVPGNPAPPASRAHSTPGHVQRARTEMRTLQVSRERWGVWLLTTLRSLDIPARTFADAWLGVSESIVRRLFSAEKPLTVAHVECAPDELAEAFVEEFVRQKFGDRGGLVAGPQGPRGEGPPRPLGDLPMTRPILLWHALPCVCATCVANRPDEAASAAMWRELVTAARRRRALKAPVGAQLALGGVS